MDLYNKLIPKHKATLEILKVQDEKRYNLIMSFLKNHFWFTDLPLDEIMIITNALNIDVDLRGIINAFKQ